MKSGWALANGRSVQHVCMYRTILCEDSAMETAISPEACLDDVPTRDRCNVKTSALDHAL